MIIGYNLFKSFVDDPNTREVFIFILLVGELVQLTLGLGCVFLSANYFSMISPYFIHLRRRLRLSWGYCLR